MDLSCFPSLKIQPGNTREKPDLSVPGRFGFPDPGDLPQPEPLSTFQYRQNNFHPWDCPTIPSSLYPHSQYESPYVWDAESRRKRALRRLLSSMGTWSVDLAAGVPPLSE